MNNGWGSCSALILFFILLAAIGSCSNQKEQAIQLERIADKITAS